MQKAIKEARNILRKIKNKGKAIHEKIGNKTRCGKIVDNSVWTAAYPTCKNCLRMRAVV